MKYSEIVALVTKDTQTERRFLIPEGNYTSKEIYEFSRKVNSESSSTIQRRKHYYKVEIFGFKVEILINVFPGGPPYRIVVRHPEDTPDYELRSWGSHSSWAGIPNEVLFQVITFKNLMKDFVEDKIEWPFPPCQAPNYI